MHHHGAGLRLILECEAMAPDTRDAFVGALEQRGELHNAFTPREIALLDYAERLTTDPASIRASHVASLRAAGLDDLAIHDACAVVSYFAFVNRIADGLGVDLESGDNTADRPA